jgi:23S rRNA (cytosine1962-C5)-methyltransferase
MPELTISRRGAQRWATGHPWIYRSDIDSTGGPASGDIVLVRDPDGRALGRAFWSEHSQISLRRLTGDEQPVDASLFAARIDAAAALREQLYPGETLYRAVHGEADGLPGLVVDRYGDWLSVQFLVPGTERLRDQLVAQLAERFGCRGVVNRSDAGVRRLEGLPAERGVIHGELPAEVLVREGGLELGLDLLAGQKTGAFLDQRENHLAAGRYARGRALDCFSYAGGFALQMAGQADHVTALDVSAEACALIEANAARNGLGNLTAVCANAFDFLRAEVEAGSRYDTIVLDPPAFAKHKGARAAGLRGYKEINLRALQLLVPGGILITASCSYHVDEPSFGEMLAEAARDARRRVQVLERRGAARDHPVLLGMPESRYLKCWIVRVLD